MTSPDAAHWTLDPAVTFLTHGTFGAAPRVVLEAQRAWRDRMEREPVRFLDRELEGLLAAVRERLGAFIGAAPEDLAFVANATTGVNTVLHSLHFAPGDELLATDHEYNASLNALASRRRPRRGPRRRRPDPLPHRRRRRGPRRDPLRG